MSDHDPSAQRRLRQEALAGLDPEDARATYARIAFLVQCFAGASIALISIVEDHQVWTAGVGETPPLQSPRAQDFASQVIGGEKVLWIEDASLDRRLRKSDLVTGPSSIRFLAGAPICLAGGARIGAVTIMDRKPRPFDGFLAARLEDFAALVAEDWERRRAAVGPPSPSGGSDALGEWRLAMAKSVPVALVMTDRSFRVMRASPRWLADRGIEEAEVIGRSLLDIFPGAYDQHLPSFQSALQGEPARWDKVALVLPGGRRLWLRGEAAAWREADGAVGGLLIKTYDISDMVEAVEAAQRSEQRLRLATDLAELRVWELDFTTGRLTTFGAPIGGFGDLDGVSEIDEDLWRGVHPADRPAAIAAWERHVANGEPFRVVFRMMQLDGPHLWVAAAAEAVWGPGGKIERVVGVLKNIDRETRAEQAMAGALQAAEAANRSKSEFLANMSHEIRTPLNGVMGVASALGRTDLAPAQREMVELIGASAHALDALLSDVLDLARIEAGRLELRNEPFDLAESLRLVTGLFEAKAKDKGLAFKTTVSPAAKVTVRGDVVRLRQIASNLMSNAVKFTTEGKVSMQVEAERIEGLLRLRLSVVDTGIGFDAETERRLFQRFEQADGSITRRFGGAGLGLAISRSLAEAMGGRLSATATPGKGAAFTLELELPCVEAVAPAEAVVVDPFVDEPPPPAAEDPPQPGPMRILLAEDHPTNRKVVGLILEAVNLGYSAVLVRDCAAGFPDAHVESMIRHSLTPISTITTSGRIMEVWQEGG